MIEFVTILAAVTLANVVSMFIITAYNVLLDRKAAEKRRELLDKAMASLDEQLKASESAAPKSAKKATTAKRIKKD